MHNMGLLGKRPKERYHSYKGNVADNIINRILMRVDHYKNRTTDVSQFNFVMGKMLYFSNIR